MLLPAFYWLKCGLLWRWRPLCPKLKQSTVRSTFSRCQCVCASVSVCVCVYWLWLAVICVRVTAQRCPINFARFRLQFFLPFRFVFNFVLLYFRCYFLWDNYFSSSKFFFLHYDCANLFSKLNDFGSSWSLNQIVIARSCFSLSPKLILRCLMWQVSDDSIGFFYLLQSKAKNAEDFFAADTS